MKKRLLLLYSIYNLLIFTNMTTVTDNYDKPLLRSSSFLVYPPVHHHLTFDLYSQWDPFLTDSAAVRMTKGEGEGHESEP